MSAIFAKKKGSSSGGQSYRQSGGRHHGHRLGRRSAARLLTKDEARRIAARKGKAAGFSPTKKSPACWIISEGTVKVHLNKIYIVVALGLTLTASSASATTYEYQGNPISTIQEYEVTGDPGSPGYGTTFDLPGPTLLFTAGVTFAGDTSQLSGTFAFGLDAVLTPPMTSAFA